MLTDKWQIVSVERTLEGVGGASESVLGLQDQISCSLSPQIPHSSLKTQREEVSGRHSVTGDKFPNRTW